MAGVGETILTVDGLGAIRRARVRRRGRGGNNAPAPALPTVAVQTATNVPSEKYLGVYIPTNTVKNLLVLRAANLKRLQSEGKKVSGGFIPMQGLDGLGSWLSKISDAAGRFSSFVSPVASFVPGGSFITSSIRNATDLHDKANSLINPSAPSKTLIPINAPAPAPKSYEDKYADESREPYNREVNGLEGILPKVVTDNPVASVLGGAALCLLGYELLFDKPATKHKKGLGGVHKKHSPYNGKANAKKFVFQSAK
jgi:hypothetical protein